MKGLIYESEFQVSNQESQKVCKDLLKEHNTPHLLFALKEEGIDSDLFVEQTYLAVQLEECGIRQDNALRATINSLIGEKVVLTNHPAPFAWHIMKVLGIADLFDNVYGMLEIDYVRKPHPRSMRIIRSACRQKRPVIYLDDQLENIDVAHQLGAQTVLVSSSDLTCDVPDYRSLSLRSDMIF